MKESLFKEKVFKIGDLFVILTIVLIAFVILFSTGKGTFVEGSMINIKINGETVKTIKVDGSMEGKIEHIHSEFGDNEIIFTKHGVKMHDSDCKDKLCIKMGEITTKGESIVCLPNRLVIEIEPGDDGLDVLLH